ncbi:MAG: hypothetical protein WCI23_08250 [Chlorobiaceae bacterium]
MNRELQRARQGAVKARTAGMVQVRVRRKLIDEERSRYEQQAEKMRSERDAARNDAGVGGAVK